MTARTSMDPAHFAATPTRDEFDLFSLANVDVPTIPPEPDEPSIDEQFQAFHAANPAVYQEIETRALALHASGAKRISMKGLWETLRVELQLRKEGRAFALNNSYTALYARLLLEKHPYLQDLIETRVRRSA